MAYFCPLHASNFSTNYISMQDTYVNMQDKYINMQDTYVNMQDKDKMKLIYVNMQDIYGDMQYIYVNMQDTYVNMQDNYFSYTGQENPTGSVVLDFSVWYCLSGTALPVR